MAYLSAMQANRDVVVVVLLRRLSHPLLDDQIPTKHSVTAGGFGVAPVQAFVSETVERAFAEAILDAVRETSSPVGALRDLLELDEFRREVA
ncbi:hypothetical protein [Subtercola endophyticus]|uniref:hypothetical protein n=1 Tax=Subtercola endophyticus TaxID=2895559 RepID=UPI001E45EBEF|nr:hypothetical protein [Subtercola endophyticus]UFS59198.1 hypothetical protein LQ955_19850 [Subtercola endophyticus]